MVHSFKLTEQAHGRVVSEATYMTSYAAHGYEWVGGTLIRMSPMTLRHHYLIQYLSDLLRWYFEFRPLGVVITGAFVMRLDQVTPPTRREPDLAVILAPDLSRLMETFVDGPANLCIEVVSDESIERDYITKWREYEQAGVTEYWIVDPLRKECRFFRLGEDKHYGEYYADEAASYRTPLLPDFVLEVPTLWSDPLPGPAAVSEAVHQMLNG